VHEVCRDCSRILGGEFRAIPGETSRRGWTTECTGRVRRAVELTKPRVSCEISTALQNANSIPRAAQALFSVLAMLLTLFAGTSLLGAGDRASTRWWRSRAAAAARVRSPQRARRVHGAGRSIGAARELQADGHRPGSGLHPERGGRRPHGALPVWHHADRSAPPPLACSHCWPPPHSLPAICRRAAPRESTHLKRCALNTGVLRRKCTVRMDINSLTVGAIAANRCCRVPHKCPSPPTGVGGAPLRWAHPGAGGARPAAATRGSRAEEPVRSKPPRPPGSWV
jgi:hypothetical protein